MTSSLKAKFLQHLASKKRNGGFTLIELLVVIIIIGILAAIALPSFLNQANKAKQSEAKTYVGSMNRAQQAYFLENNEFVILDTNIPQLGLGIRAKTENYEYKVTGDNAKPAKSYSYANVVKTNAPLKAYIGGVVVGEVGDDGKKDATTLAILCEAKNPNGVNKGTQTLAASDITLNETTTSCVTNSVPAAK